MSDKVKVTDVTKNVHVTRTSDTADVGRGVHVTTEVGKTKVRDYFTETGEYKYTTPA